MPRIPTLTTPRTSTSTATGTMSTNRPQPVRARRRSSPRASSSSRRSCPGSPSSPSASARMPPSASRSSTGSRRARSSVDWAFRIDTLTVVMLVVVTTVSSLVHIYSIGYMAHDPYRPRFFAYLSMFTFAMLALVTADNLVQLFFGWEGVGLASYLLIGFWYKRPGGQRRRDQGLHRQPRRRLRLRARHLRRLRPVQLGRLRDDLRQRADASSAQTMHFLSWDLDALTVVCLLLFMGAMGKSAQFLLHTWLPDAMEGPTPVSALIHAATMVTAGVFMVARLSPLFELSPRRRSTVVDLHRRDDRVLRRDRRSRPERHQARHRLFDLLAARLHVRRAWASAPIRSACSTSSPTPSSRRSSSSAPARSSTPSPASRTCARWAGSASTSRSPTG